MHYDPDKSIDPKQWLALDESEQLDLVAQYHKAKDIELPSLELHAAIHCTVENQVALGDEYPAKATLERLIHEGLGRHEAIHAIASVLTGHIWEHQTEGTEWNDAAYRRELENLTAGSRLHSFDEEE